MFFSVYKNERGVLYMQFHDPDYDAVRCISEDTDFIDIGGDVLEPPTDPVVYTGTFDECYSYICD